MKGKARGMLLISATIVQNICNNKKTWLNNPTATFEIFIKEDAEESESDDDDVNFVEVGKADKTCSVFIEILGKHMDKTPVGFFIYSGLPPYNPNKYHDDDPKFIGQPWIQKQFVGTTLTKSRFYFVEYVKG